MTLGTAISDVKASEASLVSASDDKIKTLIKLGVIDLYKRFDILTKEYIVEMSESKTEYEMPNGYIQPLEAFGETLEQEIRPLAINDEFNALSIMTVSYNKIQVPNPADYSAISVIYRAMPDSFPQNNDDILPIPDYMLDLLYTYIGYKVSISKEETDKYYWRYIRECENMGRFGVLQPKNLAMPGVEEKGFI